jgi:hypothetical protein
VPSIEYQNQNKDKIAAYNIQTGTLFANKMSKVTESSRVQRMKEIQLKKVADETSACKNCPKVTSHSMNQFKESIVNSQIKRNANPKRWVNTKSLVHTVKTADEQKSGAGKPVVSPLNFKIRQMQNKTADTQEKSDRKVSPRQKCVEDEIITQKFQEGVL